MFTEGFTTLIFHAGHLCALHRFDHISPPDSLNPPVRAVGTKDYLRPRVYIKASGSDHSIFLGQYSNDLMKQFLSDENE